MATTTFTVAPTATNGSLFYAWAHQLAAFMATAGWVQQGDTGQGVWPASIVNITAVSWDGAHATYTYTLARGAVLRSGSTIIVKGCTTSAMNGTFAISSLGSGTFLTVNATAASSESEPANTAWGSVDVNVTITNALGNGATNTYTYTNTDGVLIIGQTVVITGCSTSGFNGTFTVASIDTGAGTFTTTAGGISHAGEGESATGLVTVLAAVISTQASGTSTIPPAASNSIYEIWKMGDGLGLPVYLKIYYGGNTNNAANAGLQVQIAAGTDGAGNTTGGSTAITKVFENNVNGGGATNPSFLSGSSNRMQWGLFVTNTVGSVAPGLVNIERSHDSSGADTTSYATLSVMGSGPSGVIAIAQQSITSTAVTTAETRMPAITKTSTATGSFGSNTILSPVFPVVGAVGNPLIGVLIGKVADWTDQTQFSFSLYNTAHNYIVFNTAGSQYVAANVLVYDATATCCPVMRYE